MTHNERALMLSFGSILAIGILILWIDNEQGSYNERCRMVEEAWEQAVESDKPHFSRSENARLDLAERLKTWIHDESPELGASVYSDLLTAALGEVDWMEIADNWLT